MKTINYKDLNNCVGIAGPVLFDEEIIIELDSPHYTKRDVQELIRKTNNHVWLKQIKVIKIEQNKANVVIKHPGVSP